MNLFRSAPVMLSAGLMLVSACGERAEPSRDAPSSPLVVEERRDAPDATVPNTAPASSAAPVTQTETPAAPRSGAVRTPAAGSAERRALMDALRAEVRGDLGMEPVFVVQTLRTDGQWAFGVLEPTLQGGGRIRPESTPLYRRHGDEGALDGLRIEAIWRRSGEGWRVVNHAIGATDVWWLSESGRVPSGLMTGC